MLFKVVGYNFESVILGYENFANVIKQRLINNGIGVNNLIVGQSTNTFTGYYELLIDIQTAQGENVERVRNLLYITLAGDLNSIGVDYISVANTPTVIDANNTNGTNDFLSNFAKGAGISTPILIGGLAVLLLLYLKK